LRFGAVLRTEGKEFAVFGGRTDQRVILRERQLKLRRLIGTLKCLFEQPLDDRAHLFVPNQATSDSGRVKKKRKPKWDFSLAKRHARRNDGMTTCSRARGRPKR
jgi:hypothetical protein